MTIKEIKEYFKSQQVEAIPRAIVRFKEDPREGVKQTCRQYERKHENYLRELERIDFLREFDQVFKEDKNYFIAGVDEAGRGPLAGPVVAAAVILEGHTVIEGIDDSKKLTAKKRDELYEEIMDKAVSVGVGIVNADIIDEINILQATFKAMKKAVFSLEQEANVLLVDGNMTIPGINPSVTQHAIIQGDAKSMSVAAASIIAKVTRDRIMLEHDHQYPEYLWRSNKGYGSAEHQEALHEYGPTDLHRMTFLKNILGE